MASAKEGEGARNALEGLLKGLRQGFTGGTEHVEYNTITLAMWASGHFSQRDGSALGDALLDAEAALRQAAEAG